MPPVMCWRKIQVILFPKTPLDNQSEYSSIYLLRPLSHCPEQRYNLYSRNLKYPHLTLVFRLQNNHLEFFTCHKIQLVIVD